VRNDDGSDGWCQAGGTNAPWSDVRRAAQSLLGSCKGYAGLQEQLKAADDADAVVTIAKAAIFVISAEEPKRAQAEISEDELARVDTGHSAGVGFAAVWGGWQTSFDVVHPPKP